MGRVSVLRKMNVAQVSLPEAVYMYTVEQSYFRCYIHTGIPTALEAVVGGVGNYPLVVLS
jgi:formate-dependent phosphoribosylglycinamide formyltransferase (GAR transformylase)